MTPLDKCLSLYLTTHNIHNRETVMPLVGFENIISAGEQLQTSALDHTATATVYSLLKCEIKRLMLSCTIFCSYFIEGQLEVILITDGSPSLPYFLESSVGTVMKRIKHLSR
jgi:hypothetical protein